MNWFIGRVECYLCGEDKEEMIEQAKINGVVYPIERILKDGNNFIKVRDLEQAGFIISNEGSMAVITTKQEVLDAAVSIVLLGSDSTFTTTPSNAKTGVANILNANIEESNCLQIFFCDFSPPYLSSYS